MFALFIAEKPGPGPDQTQARDSWDAATQQKGDFQALLESSRSILQLNEGTFWIPVANGLDKLAELATICTRRGLAYRTLMFETEPAWIKYKPSLTTTMPAVL